MDGAFAVVVPRFHHGNSQLSRVLAGAEPYPPERPLADQLVAGTADETTGSLRVHRTAEGLKGRRLLCEAIAALTEERHPFVASEGVHLLLTDDGRAASRLLLPALFQALPLQGRPLAAAPHAGLVIVTGDEDPAGLARLVTLAGQAFARPDARRLAPAPMVLDGDAWSPWLPEPHHPFHRAVHDLRLRYTGLAYQAQRQALTLLRQTGVAVPPVAPLDASPGPLYDRHTLAPWTQTLVDGADRTDALLPDADRVVLVRGDQRSAPLEMSAVRRRCAALIEPLASDPPLLRVRGFPTEAMRADLGVV